MTTPVVVRSRNANKSAAKLMLDNLDLITISEMLPDVQTVQVNLKTSEIVIQCLHNTYTVSAGSWIVIEASGIVDNLSDGEFENKYEVI